MKGRLISFIYALTMMGLLLMLTTSCKKDKHDSIFPPSGELVTDIDGNIYHTVVIGSQTWMSENLTTTRYRNGDSIGTTYPKDADLSNLIEPKYQWAYNDQDNLLKFFGRLYTWYVVNDSRNIAPEGWHVSTDTDWAILTNFLGGDSIAAPKLKDTELISWQYPYNVTTNQSGFTALPGGIRGNDQFALGGQCGCWWTSTDYTVDEAWERRMDYLTVKVEKRETSKKFGLSVRCVKD
jgi:uncharacterized protein (TIGR02145 family)